MIEYEVIHRNHLWVIQSLHKDYPEWCNHIDTGNRAFIFNTRNAARLMVKKFRDSVLDLKFRVIRISTLSWPGV
jgi:hypothetical protein